MAEPVPASAFIAAARELLDTPFVMRGHSVGEVDCVGFPYVAARTAGVRLDEQPNYSVLQEIARWDYDMRATKRLLERLQVFCQRVDERVPGCLVLIKLPRLPDPQHFAIYCGKRLLSGEAVETIIHADAFQRRVVEHGYRGSWLKRTHSFWLLPGIAYGQ